MFDADVFEEVLEIVSYMTFYSPTISLDMWSLWPLIMDALGDWAIDFFESKPAFLGVDCSNFFLSFVYFTEFNILEVLFSVTLLIYLNHIGVIW